MFHVLAVMAPHFLVFDPATFLNNVKNVLILAVAVVVGYAVVIAAAIGRVQKALIVCALGAIALLAITGSLLLDIGHWFTTNGLG